MYMSAVMSAFYVAKQAREEERRFEDLCGSLPKKKADELREERKLEKKEQAKIREQHRRDLAVAEAGRSKNFWGNR